LSQVCSNRLAVLAADSMSVPNSHVLLKMKLWLVLEINESHMCALALANSLVDITWVTSN